MKSSSSYSELNYLIAVLITFPLRLIDKLRRFGIEESPLIAWDIFLGFYNAKNNRKFYILDKII